jgi:hypothetical protein
MAPSIFSGLSQYGGFITIAKYIGWGFLFLVMGLLFTFGILMLVVQFKKKKVIELNLVTKKVRFLNGRFKKNRMGVKQLWVGRLRKFIPRVQEKDVYTKGKKDVIMLVKDNNGLHHTARLPSYDEMKMFYSEVYNIDIEDKESKEYQKLKQNMKTVYLLPNPSEDLNWLANQCVEADKEFAMPWWKSPAIMVIGTVFLCVMMFIISAIINKKM